MRSLHLLRHATPSSSAPSGGDFERSLTHRGVREARALGHELASRPAAERPTVALCSPARRTRETLEAISQALPDLDVREPEALYGASSTGILEVVAQVEPDVRSLLVIGHNPGIAVLANELATTGRPALLERIRHTFPPGALVSLGFEAAPDWQDLPGHVGQLDAFVIPTDLSDFEA